MGCAAFLEGRGPIRRSDPHIILIDGTLNYLHRVKLSCDPTWAVTTYVMIRSLPHADHSINSGRAQEGVGPMRPLGRCNVSMQSCD